MYKRQDIVSSTSDREWEAVGIILSIITPLGTTGYITPEQKILYYVLKSLIRFVHSNTSPFKRTGVTGDSVVPISKPLDFNPS